jgi:hypothetical protein
MTDTMISQNIDLSSRDILYIKKDRQDISCYLTFSIEIAMNVNMISEAEEIENDKKTHKA